MLSSKHGLQKKLCWVLGLKFTPKTQTQLHIFTLFSSHLHSLSLHPPYTQGDIIWNKIQVIILEGELERGRAGIDGYWLKHLLSNDCKCFLTTRITVGVKLSQGFLTKKVF